MGAAMFTESSDESPANICESYEGSLTVRRVGHLETDLTFFGIHGNSFHVYYVSKIHNSGNMKFTFFSFDIQLIFLEFGQHELNLFNVFFKVCGIDENVIYVCYCESN